MDFLQTLTDDQTALLGSFVALAAAGLVMSLSYYLGHWNRSASDATHRLPQSPDAQNERERSSKAA